MSGLPPFMLRARAQSEGRHVLDDAWGPGAWRPSRSCYDVTEQREPPSLGVCPLTKSAAQVPSFRHGVKLRIAVR
jgi:hypothetical protein